MLINDSKKPTIQPPPTQIIVRTNKGRMLITPVHESSSDLSKPIQAQSAAGLRPASL